MIKFISRKLMIRKARKEQPDARWVAVDANGDAYSYHQSSQPRRGEGYGTFIPDGTDYYWFIGTYPNLAGEVHAL